MANELATKNSFSTDLAIALEENKAALPDGFNSSRFVQNCVALLNGNDGLQEFAKKYGTAQIKMGLLRGAYLGLDALNQEMYLVPYGSTLNFMSSYTGMIKLAKMYSQRPIKDIYAKSIREGETFESGVANGVPYINHIENKLVKAPIIGVYAVCIYEDGGILYDVMSSDDVEQTRSQSKAKGAMPWVKFWEQMALKTVIRRLCKTITLDMDANAKEAFDSGLEIETDQKVIAEQQIEEESDQIDLMGSGIIDAEVEEVFK